MKPLFGITSTEESGYRQYSIKQDTNLTMYGLLIVAVAWIAFIFNDYQILGVSSLFFIFTALRIILATAVIFTILFLTKVNTYQAYDRAIFVLAFALIIATLAINATRPQSFIAHSAIACGVILLVGLYIPTKFVNQTILAAICCIGEIIIVTLSLPWVFGLFSIIFSLVMTLIVTVVCSYNLQLFRRKDYRNIVKLSELKNRVENHSIELERVLEERTKQLKLSERLSAIGMTAGMIGHDIRNPLQPIEGDLYLLKTDLDEVPENDVKEGMKEDIASIEENVNYINKIVSDLQDYSRPLNPTYVKADMRDLVTKTIQGINTPKNVSLSIDIGAIEPVETDPEYLRRILTNLILNGSQAMPKGGNLTVDILEKKGRVQIRVKDTGIGIPEEFRSKLFTPMMTTKSKGQGLGLAVVKRLVEALDGAITYESQVGEGTVFILDFPLKQRQLVTGTSMS